MTTPRKTAVKAIDSDIAEAKDKGFGTVTFEGVAYKIERKPNTLLISELARTGSGDPEAMAVLAEFFEVTLGSEYPASRRPSTGPTPTTMSSSASSRTSSSRRWAALRSDPDPRRLGRRLVE